MVVETLTDRLAAGLCLYVENYFIAQDGGKLGLKPSYKVDYEIHNIDNLYKHTNIDDFWVHVITGSKHISELPVCLQELVRQYLPRFLKDYPQYKDNPYFID